LIEQIAAVNADAAVRFAVLAACATANPALCRLHPPYPARFWRRRRQNTLYSSDLPRTA
jgi:hypothetical protein